MSRVLKKVKEGVMLKFGGKYWDGRKGKCKGFEINICCYGGIIRRLMWLEKSR